MNKQLLMAINQICAERNLKPQVVIDAVEQALVSAYKRNFGNAGNVTAQLDPETGDMRIFARLEVVAEGEVLDPKVQVSVRDAALINAQKAHPGEEILIERTPDDFGRIAAQTAKQVILQRIREAERDAVFEEYSQRSGELAQGVIRTIDHGSGNIIVSMDGGRVEGALAKTDQIPGERYRQNASLLAYVNEVTKGNRGPLIQLSRSHRNMLRRLLEKEVPEIKQGTVEIKAIAREAGSRSKIAVWSAQPGVDPVGSCVGMRGVRIQNIVNELSGEKIDVIEWHADAERFVANALSPARVVDVLLFPEHDKTAMVVVPDNQLSLAIGKEGQNARLVAKLTGWRIDIKSESDAAKEGVDEFERQRIRSQQKARVRDDDLLEAAKRILAPEEPIIPELAPIEPRIVEAPAFEDVMAKVELREEEIPALPAPPPPEPVAEASGLLAEPDLAAQLAAAMSSITDEDNELFGDDPTGKKKKGQKRTDRQLVFDEDRGQLVAVKKRKKDRGGARGRDFYSYGDEDV